MGLFDSIKDAASSVADKVGDGIDKAKKTVSSITKKVEEAPAAIAKGAGQALEGAKELGRNFVKDPVGTIASGAKQAVEGARHIGRKVVAGAKVAGEWAWKHKGEIGFWVGTTALMLAVPVSGGASGALAGGMMAARGAAIAAKVAQAGRVGATAVKVAKTAATAVQATKGAAGATKAGATLARTGEAIHAGRVALGGTKAGKAMMAAQKPVGHVASAAFGMHFADTANKYRQGKASNKDMALATLGMAPIGLAGFKGIAKAKAALANKRAANVVTKSIDIVASKTAVAGQEAGRVALGAPRVQAPQTAGAAAAARDDAAAALDKALTVRRQAAVTSRAANADDAVSATTLRDDLQGVADRARLAREHADDAVGLAPEASLTRTAQNARAELDDAADIALQTRHDISRLASKQQRADKVADTTGVVEEHVANAGLHAYTVNNGINAAAEGNREGFTTTDGSLLRNLGWIVLGRTQRAA